MLSRRVSLNALRAFESAARLRSMTLAADELCVTHGAVSRHIRSLEDSLGAVLLNRGSHSTDPTVEGRRLAEDLVKAFGLIEASLDQFRPGPLTISCSPSMLMFWLLPRISTFNGRFPEIQLQFNMNYEHVDFRRDRIAVAIRNSAIAPPEDVDIRELATEEVGVVCSPGCLASLGTGGIEAVSAAHLLASKTRPDAWGDWARAAGLAATLTAHEYFDHFYLLIQAAVCGLGLAVVPRILVQEDLQSGKLVAPFGFVPGGRKLVLWSAPRLATRPELNRLAGWLAEELETSNASVRHRLPDGQGASAK